MPVPRHYVDEARNTLSAIDSWFSQAVQERPSAVMSLVAERASKINRQIYESFTNRRKVDLQRERDVNQLELSCWAGRARPFGRIPRDSSSGTVERDNYRWINVPEENRVHVQNNHSGGHEVDIADDRTQVKFRVFCTGVAFEDMTRGHGAYRATLHASFRYTEDAIDELVDLERIALQRELGL